VSIEEEKEEKKEKGARSTMPVPKGKEEPNVIMLKSSPFKVIGPDGKKVEEVEEEEKSNKQNSNSKKEYKVNAFKVPKNPLIGQEDIAVQVMDPTWHDDGFFSTKYVTFLVKTPSMGFEVRRKDKDFILLHEYL
jgi:hypothetical protein